MVVFTRPLPIIAQGYSPQPTPQSQLAHSPHHSPHHSHTYTWTTGHAARVQPSPALSLSRTRARAQAANPARKDGQAAKKADARLKSCEHDVSAACSAQRLPVARRIHDHWLGLGLGLANPKPNSNPSPSPNPNLRAS